jgi:LysM repeat protein
LSKYATQNGITISRIQQVNCLSGIVIREGSTLLLPVTVTPTPSPTPTPLPQQPPSGPPSDSSSDSPKPPPKPTATPP